MKRVKFAIFVAVVSSFLSGGAFAQQGKEGNWMYDFVELRTYAMTVNALGRSTDLISPFSGKIVGGSPAGSNDNPFQVALLQKNVPNNFNAQFCGGTLIKPDIVVTAAHCSDFATAGEVQVLTGTRKLDGSGVRRNVAKIALHPKWNKNTFDYDVAVWKLSSPASGAPLATLASEDGSQGSQLMATGWGALTEGGTFPIDLMKVLVPLASRTDCNDANSYSGKVTERMLCAGVSGKDTCQGDSGGPLTRGAGNTVLTGITSWGRGCAQPNYFGVYARVSNAEIRRFIEANDD